MPEPKEDRLCVPCLLVFCAIAIAILLLLKCIKFTCDRNHRRVALESTPCDAIATELVDLEDGGNKIVVNPDGEMMAGMNEVADVTSVSFQGGPQR
jgi:hypothetical protein